MLNDVKIRKAKPTAGKIRKIAHRKGLYIEVRPNGTKYWRYRYRGPGKTPETACKVVEHVYTIGEYCPGQADHIPLQNAEELHAAARAMVKSGKHPLDEARRATAQNQADAAMTFESVARSWLEMKQSTEWVNAWSSMTAKAFEADVFPKIGKLPIRYVSASHMLSVIESISARGAPTTAIRVRSWCSAIFKYAASKLLIDIGSNPADIVSGAVKRPKVKHKTPLTQEQIPELMKKTRGGTMGRPRQIAMELLMRLFTRPSELREAKWSEIDFERGEWVIPAERMKMSEAHFVPLPTQAIRLLTELKPLAGDSDFLFPNVRSRKKPMSKGTLNFALNSMGYDGQFSAHGFRATASTLLTRLGFHADVIERQLSHAPRDKIRASYQRYEFHDERRAMLQSWSDFIDGLCSEQDKPKVVPIQAAA